MITVQQSRQKVRVERRVPPESEVVETDQTILNGASRERRLGTCWPARLCILGADPLEMGAHCARRDEQLTADKYLALCLHPSNQYLHLPGRQVRSLETLP